MCTYMKTWYRSHTLHWRCLGGEAWATVDLFQCFYQHLSCSIFSLMWAKEYISVNVDHAQITSGALVYCCSSSNSHTNISKIPHHTPTPHTPPPLISHPHPSHHTSIMHMHSPHHTPTPHITPPPLTSHPHPSHHIPTPHITSPPLTTTLHPHVPLTHSPHHTPTPHSSPPHLPPLITTHPKKKGEIVDMTGLPVSNVDQSHDDIAKSRQRPVDAPSLLK